MNENALATELLTQINEVKQDFKIAMEEYNHQQKRACDAEAERDALAVENARLRAGYQRIRETFRDEKFSGVDVSNEAEFIAQRLLNWDELSKVTQEDMNALLGLFKAQSHE